MEVVLSIFSGLLSSLGAGAGAGGQAAAAAAQAGLTKEQIAALEALLQKAQRDQQSIIFTQLEGLQRVGASEEEAQKIAYAFAINDSNMQEQTLADIQKNYYNSNKDLINETSKIFQSSAENQKNILIDQFKATGKNEEDAINLATQFQVKASSDKTSALISALQGKSNAEIDAIQKSNDLQIKGISDYSNTQINSLIKSGLTERQAIEQVKNNLEAKAASTQDIAQKTAMSNYAELMDSTLSQKTVSLQALNNATNQQIQGISNASNIATTGISEAAKAQLNAAKLSTDASLMSLQEAKKLSTEDLNNALISAQAILAQQSELNKSGIALGDAAKAELTRLLQDPSTNINIRGADIGGLADEILNKLNAATTSSPYISQEMINAGNASAVALQKELSSDFTQSPLYQQELKSTTDSIKKEMAARGILRSGAEIQAITEASNKAAANSSARRVSLIATGSQMGQAGQAIALEQQNAASGRVNTAYNLAQQQNEQNVNTQIQNASLQLTQLQQTKAALQNAINSGSLSEQQQQQALAQFGAIEQNISEQQRIIDTNTALKSGDVLSQYYSNTGNIQSGAIIDKSKIESDAASKIAQIITDATNKAAELENEYTKNTSLYGVDLANQLYTASIAKINSESSAQVDAIQKTAQSMTNEQLNVSDIQAQAQQLIADTAANSEIAKGNSLANLYTGSGNIQSENITNQGNLNAKATINISNARNAASAGITGANIDYSKLMASSQIGTAGALTDLGTDNYQKSKLINAMGVQQRNSATAQNDLAMNKINTIYGNAPVYNEETQKKYSESKIGELSTVVSDIKRYLDATKLPGFQFGPVIKNRTNFSAGDVTLNGTYSWTLPSGETIYIENPTVSELEAAYKKAADLLQSAREGKTQFIQPYTPQGNIGTAYSQLLTGATAENLQNEQDTLDKQQKKEQDNQNVQSASTIAQGNLYAALLAGLGKSATTQTSSFLNDLYKGFTAPK